MAEQKRYYWLKLDKDFFRSKRIKKLRRLAGGDTFTIIYLKMQLLSLTTNGCLEYTGLESSFEEELALDIDEDIENIKITVAYLIKCELLIENDASEYRMPFVQNSIGSETASTIRSRKSRSKSLQCNNDASLPQQNCSVEKEIEKEIETEIDTDKDKKIKKDDVYFPDEKLNQAFLDYMDMRKRIKKPLATERAIKLAISKLNDLARIPFSESMDNDLAIKILNESIMNSWQGLFPLKGNGKSGKIDWSTV